jgi:hypothetical protein
MAPVIVSLTTIPSRVGTLPQVIASLLQQRGVPFEIQVNVQAGTVITNPVTDARVRYFDVPNEGPISKLLGTLRRVTDPDTRIVLVDDDHLYDPGMLAAYADWIARPEYARAALGFQGLIYRHDWQGFESVTALPPQTTRRVEYLQGFKSLSVRRDHFPVAFTEGWAYTHWGDDWTLGSWLGAYGVPRVVVSAPHETDFRPRAVSFPVMAEVPHPVDGCAILRERDGGVAKSDAAYLSSPMRRYADLST